MMTIDKQSLDYSSYLNKHISNVLAAFNWINDNIPQIMYNEDGYDVFLSVRHNIINHDVSKFTDDEWDAYKQYFYGDRTEEIEKDFDVAWLHHIHNNPHHWQYWVLIEDDSDAGHFKLLDMPYEHIIEMICDWWSFSWAKDDLFEIFSWYKEHENKMLLSAKTKKQVENILAEIRKKLEE